MKFQHNVKTAMGQALAFVVPGLVLGILLLVIPAGLLLNLLFTILGIVTVLYSIPGLLAGLGSVTTTEGKISLISSAFTLGVGFALIFSHSKLLMLILGVYLLIMPIVTVVMARDHMMQLRAELPKMILGVLLVLIGPAQAFDILLKVTGIVVLVLTAAYALNVCLRIKKLQHLTGTRVFVDTDGNGKVDAVYVDTDGNGKVDTKTRYKEDQ